jgi:hypothetical protein
MLDASHSQPEVFLRGGLQGVPLPQRQRHRGAAGQGERLGDQRRRSAHQDGIRESAGGSGDLVREDLVFDGGLSQHVAAGITIT